MLSQLGWPRMLSTPRNELPPTVAPFYRRHPSVLAPELVDRLSAISHNYKFAYFRVFKAANSTAVASLYFGETGTSVTDLGSLQTIKDSYYAKASTLSLRQVQELERSYLKFTVVRDPYTRILAAYLNKVLPNEKGKRDIVNRGLGRRADAEVNFSAFLSYLEQGGILENAHWCRQADMIPYRLDGLDVIARIESLDRDLAMILERIFRGKRRLISVRVHATGATREHLLLNESSRARIFALYEADFESLGYPQ